MKKLIGKYIAKPIMMSVTLSTIDFFFESWMGFKNILSWSLPTEQFCLEEWEMGRHHGTETFMQDSLLVFEGRKCIIALTFCWIQPWSAAWYRINLDFVFFIVMSAETERMSWTMLYATNFGIVVWNVFHILSSWVTSTTSLPYLPWRLLFDLREHWLSLLIE